MAEMAVYYDILENEVVLNSIRGYACFSDLFFQYNPQKKVTDIRVWYWVQTEKCRESADWFANEVIPQFIPDRLRDAVIVEDDNKPNFDIKQGVFWKTIRFNVTEITSEELYVLLALYRYPQENKNFALKLAEYIPQYGVDVAFLLSHANGMEVGGGHALIDMRTKYLLEDDTQVNDIKDYSFKSIFDNLQTLCHNKTKYPLKVKKYSPINRLFSL